MSSRRCRHARICVCGRGDAVARVAIGEEADSYGKRTEADSVRAAHPHLQFFEVFATSIIETAFSGITSRMPTLIPSPKMTLDTEHVLPAGLAMPPNESVSLVRIGLLSCLGALRRARRRSH